MNFRYALTAALLCGTLALAGAEKKAGIKTAPVPAKIDAEKKAKAEAEAKAKIDAEKKAKAEAEAKTKIDAEKKAKAERDAEAARFEKAWRDVEGLWNAKKYDEVEKAVESLEKTYKNPVKFIRAMRYGDLYNKFNGDEKLRPAMNAKARAWFEAGLAASAAEKDTGLRRGILERLAFFAARTGDAAGFRKYADAVCALFPANDARNLVQLRRHQINNAMRYVKGNPALAAVAHDYLREIVRYANASSNSGDLVAAYELAASLAYAEGKADEAEKATASALAGPNLNPVARARIYTWRYAGNRGNEASLAEVETQFRRAVDALGKDNAEAVSIPALQLAARAQHRTYYTPLEKHNFEVMNELLKLNLTPEARTQIIAQLVGMYEFTGDFEKAAVLAENSAAALEKRANPKLARAIADLYLRAGDLTLRSAGYLQEPTDTDTVKAFELYSRALNAADQVHSGAYLAIISLAAKRGSMSTAVAACGKLGLIPKIDPGTVEQAALAVAEGYFANDDFVRAKEWLAKVSPERKRGDFQLRIYDLAARLACIDGDYAKALEMVNKLEQTNGRYSHRRELKEYRSRLENLLRAKK